MDCNNVLKQTGVVHNHKTTVYVYASNIWRWLPSLEEFTEKFWHFICKSSKFGVSIFSVTIVTLPILNNKSVSLYQFAGLHSLHIMTIAMSP